MKGQRGQFSLILLVIVAIGLVIFVFTLLRPKGGGQVTGPIPVALESYVATAETGEIASLKEKEGITIEGDLDIVNLAFGDFYTIQYSNVDKQFVVTVDDPSREAEARQKVAEWFASKGVNDISKVSIYWHIKP